MDSSFHCWQQDVLTSLSIYPIPCLHDHFSTGTKRIITQWVRHGVDQNLPHSAFNSRKSARRFFLLLICFDPLLLLLTMNICRDNFSGGAMGWRIVTVVVGRHNPIVLAFSFSYYHHLNGLFRATPKPSQQLSCWHHTCHGQEWDSIPVG
jgi:hypothetical protein